MGKNRELSQTGSGGRCRCRVIPMSEEEVKKWTIGQMGLMGPIVMSRTRKAAGGQWPVAGKEEIEILQKEPVQEKEIDWKALKQICRQMRRLILKTKQANDSMKEMIKQMNEFGNDVRESYGEGNGK